MRGETRRGFLKTAAAGVALGCGWDVLSAGADGSMSGGRAFLDAVRRGDLDRVRALVSADAGLLAVRDDLGRSGYALALLSGWRPVAGYLREAGYESDLHEAALGLDWDRFDSLVAGAGERIVELVNADHPIGGSAMFAAAVGGAGGDIWRVYGACGDPNRVPRRGKGASALQAGLRFAELSTAEMTAAALLSNNADPNPASTADDPPLHIAAERGSAAIVEMLIRLGANVAAVNRAGRTAAEVAGAAGHEQVQSMIRQHSRIARTCRTSRTAYDVHGNRYQAPDLGDLPLTERSAFVGQSHFNLDAVKEAAARDARLVHSVATTSEICVEACGHTGRRPIVEFLLAGGAPYSLPTAVMVDDVATVTRYLDEDANRIHERGAHDFPLLWYPIIGRCDLTMTKLLLARGAKVEEQHFLGTTTLHWACMRGPVELVELLIEHGGDINRVGRKFGPAGETPLRAARRADQSGIAKLLVERGAG